MVKSLKNNFIMEANFNFIKSRVFETNNDWSGPIVRFTIGLILLPHGAQKMLGLFGGYGFIGTMNFLTDTKGLPWIIALLVIIIEFIGPFFLMVGLATRLWAISIIVHMIGIIFASHVEYGFFMNWFGNQQGEGYEYHLLIIALALVTLLNGSGKLSLDRLLTK